MSIQSKVKGTNLLIVVEISKTWILSTTWGFYCNRYFWRQGDNVLIPFLTFLLFSFLLFGLLGSWLCKQPQACPHLLILDFAYIFCWTSLLNITYTNCGGKKKELFWIMVTFLNEKFMLCYSCFWSLRTSVLVWNPGMKTCIYLCIYTEEKGFFVRLLFFFSVVNWIPKVF